MQKRGAPLREQPESVDASLYGEHPQKNSFLDPIRSLLYTFEQDLHLWFGSSIGKYWVQGLCAMSKNLTQCNIEMILNSLFSKHLWQSMSKGDSVLRIEM